MDGEDLVRVVEEVKEEEDEVCGAFDIMGTREFHVLDELDDTGDDARDDGGSCTSSDDDCDSEEGFQIREDEIDTMLDEGLPEEFRGPPKKMKLSDGSAACPRSEPRPYEEKEKIVLEEIGKNHFEVLPEGWVQVTHNSGMPVYLHKQTRVCTMSKPYFLGPGSARKHAIPISAVPCLKYKTVSDKEYQLKMEKLDNEEPVPAEDGASLAGVGNDMPCARIESVQENQIAQSLNSLQMREYCSKLFRFKTVRLMRFRTWAARRKHTKQRKQRQAFISCKSVPGSSDTGNNNQVVTLPKGTKLITFPIGNVVTSAASTTTRSGNDEAGGSRREWIMNPAGKSYVCILHEYVQHALKKQPCYQFKEIENAATPYSATVLINGMQYGSGVGSSKKAAKAEAAKATLEVLIPQMKEKILSETEPGTKGPTHQSDLDLSFFDEIRIEDPRVSELCAKTSEPSPYAILLTCLQRNFGLGDKNVKYELRTLKHQRNEVVMTVGKHTVQVPCKNKRDGKQRAAQAILQALHPHVSSWGSLLRLYGSHSLKSVKEKKQEEQQITLLQSKAAVNAPNYAILDKLRAEMVKLKMIREAMEPIGKFVPPDDVGMPTASGSDLNNVDL
nr:EOG090X04U5 [Leptodora kindtii]